MEIQGTKPKNFSSQGVRWNIQFLPEEARYNVPRVKKKYRIIALLTERKNRKTCD